MRLPTNPACVLVPMQATPHSDDAVYRRMKRRQLGDVAVAHIASVAQTVDSRTDELPAAAPESLQFQLVQSGTLIVEHDGAQKRFVAGELAVYDVSRPFRFVYPGEFRTTIVQVPRAVLGVRGDADGEPVDPRSRGRTLLEKALRTSRVADQQLGPSRAPVVSAALLSATRLIVAELTERERAGDLDRGARSSPLVEAVTEHVRRHYVEPSLSSAAIAARFHVSVRTLYAAFEREDQKLGEIVRRTRIGAAGDLLRRTDLPIRAIAREVGYTDTTAFIRAWKAATGYTPARWRREGAT